VRADAGFFLPELFELWEGMRLPCVVVAQLIEPIKNLLRRHSIWTPTELAGTEVAEVQYRAHRWKRSRRFILIRHRKAERPQAGGKKLLDVPGYRFQALATSFGSAHTPLQIWRFYNGRADCENVIKELQNDFALPTLCLKRFRASEAALSPATLSYNLTVLFQRHFGWMKKVTASTLRYWLFITPGRLVKPQRKTTIRLADPPRERDWGQRLREKILSPVPNCH